MRLAYLFLAFCLSGCIVEEKSTVVVKEVPKRPIHHNHPTHVHHHKTVHHTNTTKHVHSKPLSKRARKRARRAAVNKNRRRTVNVYNNY
ncbi:MAG: hypothetical protein H6845_00465 [Alphaproteobacteria bacterium]|nr:MAG: hypothetical protein H6845_00465 [Alphaproteobacteria bacterium]